MVRNLIYVFLFVLSGSLDLAAQRYFVVEIDRLSNVRTYKEMQFINGRPVEKAISMPIVSKGDVITLRMIQFNELIYGLDVKQKLVRKPVSNLASVILNNNPLTGYLKLSPAMEIVNGILKNPPPSIARGDEELPTAYRVARNYKTLREQIFAADEAVSSVLDEGATLDQIKSAIGKVHVQFSPKQVGDLLLKIKEDITYLSEEGEEVSLDEISEEVDGFLSLKEADYLPSGISIQKLRKVLNEVDFIVERTLVIGEGTENEEETAIDYEKFMAYLFIYKRTNPITDPVRLSKMPYQYERDGLPESDVIRQSLVVSLKVKNPKRLYWSLGAHKVMGIRNQNSYEIDRNSTQDSLIFRAKGLTVSGIMIAAEVNYDLPFSNDFFSSAFSFGIGIGVDGNKDANTLGNLSMSQVFLTTGVSLGLVKYPWLSLKTGLCWSRYPRLSRAFQPDKWYPDNFTNAALEQSLQKVVKPLVFAGISLNF